jgi:4-amino-4-deoxy-L-arabinose transferase-like glycosyltransferase
MKDSSLISENRKLLKIIVFISILSLINSLFFILVFQYRQPLDADGLEYDSIAWSFSQGHGLIYEGGPYITKPPSYIIFVGTLYTLLGHVPNVVLFIQSIIFVLICIIFYFLSRSILNEKTSILSSILLSLYFPLAYYTSGILTETFITFMLIISISLLMKYKEASNNNILLICGIFLGIAILCKPIFIFFPFAIAVYFIIQKIGYKKVLVSSGILFLGTGSILSIWILRNYIVFGDFILLSRDNMGFIVLKSVLDQDYKYLLWNDVHHWTQDHSNDPRKELLNDIEGRVDKEFQFDPKKSKDALYIKEAIKLIYQDPLQYIAGCLVRILRLWVSYPTRSGFLFKLFVTSYDLLLLLLGVIGFIFARRQWRDLSIFWLPIVYISIMHLPMHVEPRYSVPIKPYLLIFTAMGVLQIIQQLQLPHKQFFKKWYHVSK